MNARRLGRALAAAGLLLAYGGGAAFAAFEDLGAGARAAGMGGAFVAVADDVYTIYYNPAGLALLERPMLGTSYSKLFAGLTDNSNLASSFIGYAQPLQQGTQGTLGAAWNSFSLNGSLYRDDAYYLSYGRRLPFRPFDGDLYAGASVKYLSSSFGSFAEASNANSGVFPAPSGTPDPVLGTTRKGFVDSDLGLLYRYAKHYAVGAQAMHVNQPNVAFNPADNDRLPLGLKVGFDYYSLISNLTAEVDNERGPTGSRDSTFIMGAERWFPKMFIGDFAFRGGVGIGSRDFSQLSVGVSYRTGRLDVDYGFTLPVSGVASTAGTHRFGINFRFGRATEEEESLEMVLEAMRQLKAGKRPELKAQAPGLSPLESASLEEYLAQARSLELNGRYKESAEKIAAAMGIAPADKALVTRFTRLNLVSQQFPFLPDYKSDPVQAALYQGIAAYLDDDNRRAVDKVSEARRLKPGDGDIGLFEGQLERATGLKPLAVTETPVKPLSFTGAAALTRADSALLDRKYEEAIELADQVLREDPANAAAWQDLAISRFALKDFPGSIQAWRKVLSAEKSPARREEIKDYIKSIERAKSGAAAATPRLTPDEIQKLYNEGVDAFSQLEFAKAKRAFERILEADPDNVEAKKALQRVNEEFK